MLALVQQSQDPLRVSLLRSFSTRSNDLQVRLILAHQCNGKSSKGTTEEHQGDGHAEVDVKVRIARVLGQLLVAAMAPFLKQRRSARERQEQELREPEHGRSQGYGRAVSIPSRVSTGRASRPADGPV